MFTGIITDIGSVLSINESGNKFKISTLFNHHEIDVGASICCSGICLTVTEKGPHINGSYFNVDVSDETLSRTTAKNWKNNSLINLERSLKFGDEMGGHLVSGHVDCLSKIISIKKIKNGNIFTIEYPEIYKKFIASKGSVCLDGISLTVNDVFDNKFTVNIISHTENNTTWKDIKEGDNINTEIDIFARYISRQIEEK
ncbi:MAG: riboflavin synthase [Alphaproteobacteria bacterium]|tara:strand:+ start:137 stop:733 length:597 start_codon:yes stop_codon:yes gene_type:complete